MRSDLERDAGRYRVLRAVLQGDLLVAARPSTPALRGLSAAEHLLTDCTAEEVDVAVDAVAGAELDWTGKLPG